MFNKKVSFMLFYFLIICFDLILIANKIEIEESSDLLKLPLFIKEGAVYKINLGSTLPLTGGASTIGKDFSNGLNMVFNAFNRRAFEHHKNIALFSLDDQYSILKGIENIKNIRKKSSLYIGLLQDKIISLFKDDLFAGNIGTWFCMSGSQALRQKRAIASIQLRPSLKVEVEALISYVLKKKQLESILLFYEDSDWGRSGLEVASACLAKEGLMLKQSCSYPIGTVHIQDAAQVVLRSQPSAIICIAHARPTYNLIQTVLSEGFQHCQFFGTSEVAPIQYLLKKSRGINIGMSMLVPDPFKSSLPIVQSYKQEMQKNFPYVELSPFSLEGFIAGKIVTYAIEKVPHNITIGGLMEEFKKIKKAQFGGLSLDFSAESRTLSKSIWIKESFDKEAFLCTN